MPIGWGKLLIRLAIRAGGFKTSKRYEEFYTPGYFPPRNDPEQRRARGGGVRAISAVAVRRSGSGGRRRPDSIPGRSAAGQEADALGEFNKLGDEERRSVRRAPLQHANN